MACNLGGDLHCTGLAEGAAGSIMANFDLGCWAVSTSSLVGIRHTLVKIILSLFENGLASHIPRCSCNGAVQVSHLAASCVKMPKFALRRLQQYFF